MKKLQLFDQNHGLSPLEKCQFCVLFKCMFVLSWKARFVMRTSPNTFSQFMHETKRFLSLCMKRNVNKISNFSPKPWTSHFGKMPILWVFELMFSLSRKACLLYKTLKIVFSRFISTIYYMGIQGVRRGYRGWQGVTRGDRGLQGVTGGYRGLQGVTGGYKGWQGLHGVTEGYKGCHKLFSN